MTRTRTIAVLTGALVIAVIAALATCGRSSGPSAQEVAVAYVTADGSHDYGAEWDVLADELRGGRSRDQYIAHWTEAAGPPGDVHAKPVAVRAVKTYEQGGDDRRQVLVQEEMPDGRRLHTLVFLRRTDDGWRVVDEDSSQTAEELAEMQGLTS